MRAAATAVLERLGHGDIPVARRVGRLPAAAKQVVSMGRALSHDAQLLVMDEPSAVLAHDEVANLFRTIRDLTSRGIAVIYITHRLEEIREIGDRVTVLQGRPHLRGQPAGPHDRDRRPRDAHDRPRRSSTCSPTRVAGKVAADVAPLLEVEGLTRAGEFADVSLVVRAGEIVGIAGLVGSGRSELLETIYGARPSEAGQVRLDGRRLPPGRVTSAVRAGIGLAPEERKSQALILDDPIYRNVTLATFSSYATAGMTRASAERAAAPRASPTNWPCSRAGSRRPVKTLSGGNQQKAVLGPVAARPGAVRGARRRGTARHPAVAAGRTDAWRGRRGASRPVPA